MIAAVGRRWSQASNTLRPEPERTPSRHLDQAERGQAPIEGCLTPASDHEDSSEPGQRRQTLQRAPPTGSQITAALNRSLPAEDMHNDETNHDDLNDLDGERPHQIVRFCRSPKMMSSQPNIMFSHLQNHLPPDPQMRAQPTTRSQSGLAYRRSTPGAPICCRKLPAIDIYNVSYC